MRAVFVQGLVFAIWLGSASIGMANKIITSPLPETVEVCIGQDTTICVYATPLVAGDQLRYKWYKDDTLIPGEEGPCLTIRNPQLADDWSIYEVQVESYHVTGGGQIVVTASERSGTTLRVYEPPTITAQPQNWSGCEGRTLTLSVSVSGSGLSFQWYRDGQPVQGANNPTYTGIASPQRHNGVWWCVITGPCGTITTDRVQVEVRELPQITRQPSSIAECVGRQISLTVEASGYTPLTYQWYRNGVPVGTGQTYTFTADRTTEGEYWVVVSNQCGQVQSRRVVVTAYLPPQITLQPQGGTWQEGQRVVLRVESTGKLPLNYQWQKDG
ncbi:MAG: immunoglobulin domain-containing protein, partial [Candidatus Kapabacteria bacterium]|nr:immunoglobulin domain-containing protein [Candidatus Kapabacteria bacterium]